ncbi:endonuclease [Flavobacteriaceae bacterium S356]|uniref:Endonuclease n=1 Tax=Asprobacillus argus TaxID=3076534 RepID=A0ABU3LDH8_9FLAO|nr:endonuclease [Flavobacteriaceae bacterium S356]
MRKLTPWLMLLFTVATFAQIPTYYNDVNLTLTGTALKNALATKIINTHTTNLSYTPGVWDALKQTDLDPTDPTKVLLIYGWNDSDGDITNDRTRGVDQNGGGTGVWNREHVYSKSLANPNLGTSGPGADAHNLRPCDAQRNSSRSNRKFEDGNGNSGATAAGNWYPGDEWKGDVARMMMYMYLRYGNQTLPINVGVGTTVASDTNMIMLFLEWNAEDPVSDLEKQRNPVLEGLQGNRNPFIDNPAFATQIWGGPQAEDLFGGGSTDTTAPSTPINLIASNVASTSFSLSWTASTDNVAVSGYTIFLNGSQVGTSNTNNYDASGLTSSTSYTVSVSAYDTASNSSNQSTSITVNTSAGGNGTATDLLISEYIEGSSNNKAIEVANFTGSTVDLSAYTLKKQTNGSGSWSGGLSLTGQLAHGSVFVAANSNASSAITSVANITTESSEMTFNGNDAVGLFKNDVLIDMLGVFNSSATYAQNVTLQRKSSVTSPNTTYTTTEWNSLATDTFSGLGSHTIDGGSGTDTEAPSIPTSLAASNITETSTVLSWNASTDNVGVTSYTIYQGGTQIGTSSTTSFSVTGLTDSTAYTFTVRADDAAGNQSNDSNSVNITTLTPPDTQAPSNPASLVVSNVTQTSVDLSWNASTDNVGVTSYTIYQGGVQIGTSSTTTFGVTGLTASTAYTFTVRASDAAGNQSADSNSVNVTTSQNGGNGTAMDLLISEYIEGSSNNKAIEVANFTGSTVDLSAYTLKKQTNGSGSWSGGLSLTGQLAHGSVFVAANSNASSAITSVANITTGSSEMTFNGNDAVGLFKNDVLIDMLGVFNSSATYAQNVTLQRKSSVTSPNTTYTTTEWNSLATDTFSGLGSHTIDGGSGTDTEAPSIPTSLAASNITETSTVLSWNASTDNVGVTSYTIYQGGAQIGTSSTTSFSVTGLTDSTAYTFTVRADDAAGNQSNDSNSVNITTLTPPDTQAPSNPASLVANNVTQTSVDLSWNASTDNVGVTSYTIYQGGVQIGTSSTTTFGVTGLTASTAYTFTVRASDAAGNQSADSNSVNTTTNDPPTNTSTIISESYFEAGWDNWADGGSDCYRYSGSRSWEGNYSIRIRDNSGTNSAMTSEVYDISSYDTVEVEFYFYSYSMENNEDFWLRYFNGSSWETVATYARGTDFENNGFYSSIVVLDKNSYSFVNNAQFRFQNDASGNADHIYIDQVTITGKTGSTSRNSLPAVEKNIQFHRPKFEDGNSFTLYPNPVSGQQIQVFITNRENEVVTYKVTSLLGAALLSGTLVDNRINIAKLKPGIYLMQLIDGDESSIRKFIKK